jgi:hypothetical protein
LTCGDLLPGERCRTRFVWSWSSTSHPGGFVGRSSNRKRARRRVMPDSRRAVTEIQLQARRQPALAARAYALDEAFRVHDDRYERARLAWCAEDPAPAQVPRWAASSPGRRIPSWSFLRQARRAPCLLTAEVPDAAVIAADPAHWNTATSALIRAFAFDGLELRHPALNEILGLLAPVAAAELGYRRALMTWLLSERPAGRRRPEFPVLDGPVFLLGVGALTHLAHALVGGSPGDAELAVLSRALDGTIPGVAGSVVADALTESVSPRYLRELPAEILRTVKGPPYANPLDTLVTAGVVAPGDVLPAGLAILRTLIRMCQNEVTPISRQAA